MTEEVGSAFIRVRALTNQIRGDISEAFRRGIRDSDLDGLLESLVRVAIQTGLREGIDPGIIRSSIEDSLSGFNSDQGRIIGRVLAEQLGESIRASIDRSVFDDLIPTRELESSASSEGALVGRTFGDSLQEALRDLQGLIAADIVEALTSNATLVTQAASDTADEYNRGLRRQFAVNSQGIATLLVGQLTAGRTELIEAAAENAQTYVVSFSRALQVFLVNINGVIYEALASPVEYRRAGILAAEQFGGALVAVLNQQRVPISTALTRLFAPPISIPAQGAISGATFVGALISTIQLQSPEVTASVASLFDSPGLRAFLLILALSLGRQFAAGIASGIAQGALVIRARIRDALDVGASVVVLGFNTGRDWALGAVAGVRAIGPSVRDQARNLFDVIRDVFIRGLRVGAAFGDAVLAGIASRALAIKLAISSLLSGDRAVAIRAGFSQAAAALQGIAQGLSALTLPSLTARAWLAILAVPFLQFALVTITGALSAIPALLGTLGPVFAATSGIISAGLVGVIGLALSVGTALGFQNDNIQIVTDSFNELKEAFRPVAEASQAVLFPGLVDALDSLRSIVPVVAPGLVVIAEAVGNLTAELAEFVALPQNAAALNEIFLATGAGLSEVSEIIQGITGIVLTLGVAAIPIFEQLNFFLLRIVDQIGTQIQAAAADGSLAALFQRGAETASIFAGILGDVGESLIAFLGAAADGSGQQLLDLLAGATTEMREFLQSTEGQNSISSFFEAAIPIVLAVTGLLGDLGQALLRAIDPQNNDNALAFVAVLRDDIGPAIGQLLIAAQDAGPVLLDLATAFGQLILRLGESGAFDGFVQGLEIVLTQVAAFLASDFAARLGEIVLPLLGFAAAAGLVITPIVSLIGFVGSLAPLLSGLVIIVRLIGTALIGLFANPVGLVIAAVVLLVGALVAAYFQFEGFRNVVNQIGSAIGGFFVDAFNTARGAVESVGNFFTGTLIPAFQQFSSFVTDEVVPIVLTLFDTFTQPIQGVIGVVQGFIDLIVGLFTGDLDQITDGVAGIVGGVVQIFAGFPARVLPFITGLLVEFGPVVLGALASLPSLISGALISVGSAIGSAIIDLGVASLDALNSLGSTIVGGFSAALSAIINFDYAGFFSSIPGALSTAFTFAFSTIPTLLIGVGSDLIAGLTSGVTAAYEGFIAFWASLWPKLIDEVKAALGIASPSTLMIAIGQDLIQGLIDGVTGLVGLLAAVPGQIVSGLGDLASPLVNWATGAWNSLIAYLAGAFIQLSAQFSGLPGRLIAAVQAFPGLIVGWATNAIQSALNAFTTGASNINALFGGIPGRIIGAISGLAGQLSSLASSAISQMLSSFTSGVGNIASFFSGLPSRIVGALGNLGGLLRGAGSDVISGFVSGIQGAAGRVFEAARSIANSVSNTIRSALKISSPSRVAQEIGGFVGEGLRVGLLNSVGDVLQASSVLADAVDLSAIQAPRLRLVPQVADPGALAQAAQVVNNTNLTVNADSAVLRTFGADIAREAIEEYNLQQAQDLRSLDVA